LATSEASSAPAKVEAKPKRIAGAIITGHAFQHMYADAFLVLLPAIYDAFGLTAISAGLLSMVRQGAGGLLTMGGGFVVDMFSGRRGLLLSGSLFLMGLGYLFVAAAPNYTILLIALAMASAAGSFWHPVGLGILSLTFPRRRGLMMSLHRSAGNIGEIVTPAIVVVALLVITWRQILFGGFLLMTLVSIGLFLFLARVGVESAVASKSRDARGVGAQMRDIGELFKGRALPALLLLSGLRGMADRSFVFFLPLFVAQRLRETDPEVTMVAIGAWTATYLIVMSVAALLIPPVLGWLSDHVGRRPVIIGALTGSASVLGLLSIFNEVGSFFSVFTLLIAALGAARYAVTNITQAASLDIAEGHHLEGTMIGLMWGNNAAFGAIAPLLIGILVSTLSAPGEENYVIIFPYGMVMNLLALGAAFFLPMTLISRAPAPSGSA
jgi:MFS family permease